jgi:hypothetical protein
MHRLQNVWPQDRIACGFDNGSEHILHSNVSSNERIFNPDVVAGQSYTSKSAMVVVFV